MMIIAAPSILLAISSVAMLFATECTAWSSILQLSSSRRVASSKGGISRRALSPEKSYGSTNNSNKACCPFPQLGGNLASTGRRGPLGLSADADTSSISSTGAAKEKDGAGCHVPPTNTALLDRIGGEEALTAAVDGLYDRLIVDPKLSTYFEGVPMERLKMHQFNFMRMAFTEIPTDCDVVQLLVDGHDRLWKMGLDESDFDCVAGHLVDTMTSLGVGQDEIDEALSVVGPLRTVFEKDGHPMPSREEE